MGQIKIIYPGASGEANCPSQAFAIDLNAEATEESLQTDLLSIYCRKHIREDGSVEKAIDLLGKLPFVGFRL
ncbi:MAG TPA: hypothetical protein DCP92_18330 [Nitrospiraceae bacterium]|jgi:hypothetical protein|nr:hypothetical protein [Nitrospiraceae bacterium]